jgi:predicted nucleic acid-binding protein
LIVLDASAGVDLLRHTTDRADRIAARLAAESTVHVPELFDIEVLHALRGLESAKKIQPKTVAAALRDFADLRATRHRHEPLRPRIWDLRANLTAYDATYVALAELLDAPLLTSDRPLSQSSGHEARIDLA